MTASKLQTTELDVFQATFGKRVSNFQRAPHRECCPIFHIRKIDI